MEKLAHSGLSPEAAFFSFAALGALLTGASMRLSLLWSRAP